jgi:hypothetical protein
MPLAKKMHGAPQVSPMVLVGSMAISCDGAFDDQLRVSDFKRGK